MQVGHCVEVHAHVSSFGTAKFLKTSARVNLVDTTFLRSVQDYLLPHLRSRGICPEHCGESRRDSGKHYVSSRVFLLLIFIHSAFKLLDLKARRWFSGFHNWSAVFNVKR